MAFEGGAYDEISNVNTQTDYQKHQAAVFGHEGVPLTFIVSLSPIDS